jgi:hypothetical protein
MADSFEPRKETVRIAIPPKASSAPASETMRIDLPVRPPPPQRPMLPRSGTTLMPPDSIVIASGPKKETVRMGLSPGPRPAIVQLKKTQPLPRTAEPIPSSVPLNVVSQPEPDFSEQPTASGIPTAFYWALLGLSAVILLIQIWTYFS